MKEELSFFFKKRGVLVVGLRCKKEEAELVEGGAVLVNGGSEFVLCRLELVNGGSEFVFCCPELVKRKEGFWLWV